MKSIYDEFDLKCRQMDLSEVFTTKSQDTYFLMRRIFEEKNMYGLYSAPYFFFLKFYFI